MKPDGKCLVNAILLQLVHHPHKYTAEMCMRQVGLQMLKHPHHYYKYIEQELIDTGESYESYCYNVFHGNVWGDDLIASVIGDMWNVAITVITPVCKYPLHLFHNKETPDVIIVANGGSWMAEGKCSTHFSATKSTDAKHRMPGIEMVNPNLNPLIFDSASKAKDLSMKQFIRDEKCQSLEMLRSVARTIKTLDNKIAGLIRESDKLLNIKLLAEYQLEQLGVSVDKIKEAGELPPREYVRTDERKAADDIAERKRKIQEEMDKKERKKQKTVALDEEGNVMDTVEEGENTEDNAADISTMLSAHEESFSLKDSLVQQVTEGVLQQLSKPQAEQPDTTQQPMLQQTFKPTPYLQNVLSPEALAFMQGLNVPGTILPPKQEFVTQTPQQQIVTQPPQQQIVTQPPQQQIVTDCYTTSPTADHLPNSIDPNTWYISGTTSSSTCGSTKFFKNKNL